MSLTDEQGTSGKMPRQIPYIIGNEACERFSFYGMRNILTPFLISTLLLFLPQADRVGEAKHIFHSFVIGVYFFPLLGGWLADRFFGKYNTVFWLSLVYCAGHACLAYFEDNVNGFYLGLSLIALGSGGIKPLVSAFVGDQFDQTNKGKAKVVYDIFYWSINFGSFFASLLMPIFLKQYGPAVAFGIPGLLMFTATMIFWSGKTKYVHVPPAPPDPHSFTRVARSALMAAAPGQSRPGLNLAIFGAIAALVSITYVTSQLGFVIGACLALVFLLAFGGIGTSMQLERARGVHPDEAVDGVRAVLRILIVFAMVTPFWSLFDQKASTWVVQANSMVPTVDIFGSVITILPAQMQALNPMLVMLLIPFNNLVLYPFLRRFGIELSALARMTIGIAFSGLAWIVIGLLQLTMDAGTPVAMIWQILPYILLTFGEVLVSATGLEFAYSQAPRPMKGIIMAFWLLATTVGNLWVLLVNKSIKSDSVIASIQSSGMGVIAFQMFFFAAFALIVAVVFGWYARRYKMVDNYRTTD
jgi:POT family proton-dependent oligopeptide transporter